MKIKRLLVLAVLPMLCLAVNAQNSSKDNTPKKGDFTVAATLLLDTIVTQMSQPLRGC